MVSIGGQEFSVGSQISEYIIKGLWIPIKEYLVAFNHLKMVHIVEQLLHFGTFDLRQQIATNREFLPADDQIQYIRVAIQPRKTLHIDERLLRLVYVLE